MPEAGGTDQKGYMSWSASPNMGGDDLSGNEWALSNQGPSAGVRALSSMNRPTEELYRQAASPTQTVRRGAGFAGSEFLDKPESYTMASTAPGASAAATQGLKERIAPEDFQRLLGQQQEETITGAKTQLQPDVTAAAEAEARRGTYPAQAQAEGLKNQALLGFLGRQSTAEGSVEGRRATRDAAALNTLERSMGSIMEREDLTPEDKSELQRLRESIELVKRGVYFLSDLGFDDQQLDELADLEGMQDEF